MHRVNPQEYKAYEGISATDPVPAVELRPHLTELQEEYDIQNETCFVRTAAQFYVDEIAPEVYFERLIGHLRINAERHTFDTGVATKLDHLLELDPIAAAVKSWMLNPLFSALTPEDAEKLKKICLMAYRMQDGEGMRQEATAGGIPLETLPPSWLDILAVVAYARRHVSALELLVTYTGPPTQSTFDKFDASILRQRLNSYNALQHSSDTGENRLIEIRLWTALLQSDSPWIHLPLSRDWKGLYGGLLGLVDARDGNPEQRAVPEVRRLCEVLSQRDIIADHNIIARFLSATSASMYRFPEGIVPCSAGLAAMILQCFPFSRVVEALGQRPEYEHGYSAEVLLPVTQWGVNNPDRLAVMRMLLEQGYDPNDKVMDWGWPGALKDIHRDTALHMAAEQGDGDMVDLLLEFGARNDRIEGWRKEHPDTPAERALAHGHSENAARIAGNVTVASVEGGVAGLNMNSNGGEA